MKILNLTIATLLLFLGATISSAQDEHHRTDFIDLTTIKAPWTIRIVGRDLDITDVKVKPDQASAYFMMWSETAKLNVSIFIEPVDKCKTSEACRDHVLEVGNPAWGKFQDLAKGKIGDSHYFEFYRPEIQGKPMKMFDMYAQFVSQGYWVDLHISKPLYEKADHVLFEKLVGSVVFVPKVGNFATGFDVQVMAGKRTVSDWLALWENGKCRESHTALSSLTKADNPEAGWIEHCTKVNEFLGKSTSRNLIAAAFTRSLPGKTDRPVAILAYHTDFPKRSNVVEITALILEKDGRWVMTNYLPQ